MLERRRISIVGVGAVGSHVALFLRSVPDIELHVSDFDRVERKNIASQFHGLPSVGKNKASELARTLLFLFGTRHVSYGTQRVRADNVNAIAAYNASLIIDCVDNAETRRVIQAEATKLEIPCLHVGLAAGGAFGRIGWDESFTIDSEPDDGAPTCENGDFLPFIALVSALAASAAQEFLHSRKRRGYQVAPPGIVFDV